MFKKWGVYATVVMINNQTKDIQTGMEAGGVGCADNRCQNNEPNEFGLNKNEAGVL